MATSNKIKVIKDFEKLTTEELEQIKLVYPRGFRKHLVDFTGIDGQKRKGLPIETEDKYYLIRMTIEKAIYVIAEDDDYDKNGNLKSKVLAELSEKHDDDFLDDYNSNSDNDFGDEDGDISIDDLEDDVEDSGSDTSDDISL